MKSGRWVVVASALVLAAVLASCGGPGINEGSGVNSVMEGLTLEEAKRIAMEMEQEIAAIVPREYVSSIEQSQTGVLLSCDDDRGYQWTGGTDIVVRGTPNVAEIVDSVVAEYSERDSYTATLETASGGEPRAHILGEHGAGYLLSESVDKSAIEILSFSPCFRLPDDKWAGDTY